MGGGGRGGTFTWDPRVCKRLRRHPTAGQLTELPSKANSRIGSSNREFCSRVCSRAS